MGVALIVGTDKGGLIARSDDAREHWELGPLIFPGWRVTAATRDSAGRSYVGVAAEIFGCAILASDDLENWQQLESAPRYRPGEPGNLDHNRTITFNNVEVTESTSDSSPLGLYANRHVDQIWKLRSLGDTLYAGVSEAGLFRSDDRGKSWQPVSGLNDHSSRPDWGPGFGGLCLHSVLVDELDPDRIWVGISAAGVLRSDDGGRTWAFKDDGIPGGEGICVHGLAHNPLDADRIYRQDHRGMFRSLNGGDTWERIENGLPMGQLSEGPQCAFGFAIELDPASGYGFAFPLAGDDFRYPPEGCVRVYRTRDGGDSWEGLDQGLPTEPRYANVLRGAMSVDKLDPCGVYVGTTAGHVFASRDRGDSWIELPCTLPKILCVEAFAV